ncbi:hypothetical protein [Mesorhizobium sp. WSM2239]
MQRIDASAGEVRKNFITSVPGQEMVYQQKRVEAEALMAQLDIAHSEIPHIVAEAELNGIEPYDQAVIIITMSEQWKDVSAPIEKMRLGAKAAVTAATTPAEIEAAANVDWGPILAYAS